MSRQPLACSHNFDQVPHLQQRESELDRTNRLTRLIVGVVPC